MTVRYHITVKGADGTLAGVSAEGEGDNIYSEFMAAVEDLSLAQQLTAATGGQNPVGQAVAAAQAGLGATVVGGYQPAPAPAYAPAAAAPGAPVCPHGPMTRRTGTNARGAWTGYFCPSPKGTPDQCKARFE